MQAVAAGHPATAAAGAEILAEGGSAADAAVAASLASCVAETVMTGLLGGGHGIYHDAGTGTTSNLDCFVAVPGLGGERRDAQLLELQVPFGQELVHYAVGIASCGFPGLPAGLGALWTEHGRLPWARLVEPAMRLAAEGVAMPAAQASCLQMLATVMTMNEGPASTRPAARSSRRATSCTSRASSPCSSRWPKRARQPLLRHDRRRAARADGRASWARHPRGSRTYEPRWSDPVEVEFRGHTVRTRAGLGDFPEALASLPPLRGLDEPARVLALVGALGGKAAGTGTTNLAVLDADGNACVLTTSLGLGSGDFLPGFDLHLNSMLGEADLVQEPLETGLRMASMMSPAVALANGSVQLAAGAAGGTRLRSALLQVVAGVLDEGLEPQAAVDRSRLHPVGSAVSSNQASRRTRSQHSRPPDSRRAPGRRNTITSEV